jgi:HAD superfamily hydrolase (TIGR01509 family)
VSCFDVYSKEGERWDKTLDIFLKRAQIKPTQKILGEIFSHRQKIFKRYFKRFIFKGTEEFLGCLDKRGYLLGLVTGTPQAEVKKILPKSIQNLFDCIVAGDQVKVGKPHPAPYLKAAKILRCSVKECMVVENAPLGIESAKNAGMFCVALATSLPAEYLTRADVILKELEGIGEIIDTPCAV